MLDLTMNRYKDPRLLDVAEALDVLPSLPLDGRKDFQRQRATETAKPEPVNASKAAKHRTENPGRASAGKSNSSAASAQHAPQTLVPVLVPATGKRCVSQAFADNSGLEDPTTPIAVSACAVVSSGRLTIADQQRATRLELVTFSLEG